MITYMLVGRLRNFTDSPMEERVWDFGFDKDLAWSVYQEWSRWMVQGLWEFRDWGWDPDRTLIKPGAFVELDFRVARTL